MTISMAELETMFLKVAKVMIVAGDYGADVIDGGKELMGRLRLCGGVNVDLSKGTGSEGCRRRS